MSDGFRRLSELLGREAEPTQRLGYGNATEFANALVHRDKVDVAIAALTEQEYSVWFEVNPSSYDSPKGRSSAQHVTRLVALYADIDYKAKPSGMGDELSAMELIDDLSGALGVEPAAIVHSGHGLQPYWPIEDGLITADNRNQIASLLRRWGSMVKTFAETNHGGTADSVYDLARILRAPGSVNFKDPEHPVPVRIEFSPNPVPIDLEHITSTLDDWGIPTVNAEVGITRVTEASQWDWAAENCRFHSTMLREIQESNPASRHNWALKIAALINGMIRNGCITEHGYIELRDALIERFQFLLSHSVPSRPYREGEMTAILKYSLAHAESWSEPKLNEEMRHHEHAGQWDELVSAPAAPTPATEERFEPEFEMHHDQVVSAMPAAPDPLPISPTYQAASSNVVGIFTKRTLPAYSMPATVNPTQGSLALEPDEKSSVRLLTSGGTDTGNAERLAQYIRGQYIHVNGFGWMLWSGNRWTPDVDNTIIETAKDVVLQMLAFATEDEARKLARSALQRSKIMAMIDLARTLPFITQPPTALDTNAFELNTPEGVVDLRMGTMRPADPMRDFHTHITRFSPRRMPTPKFDEFISWTMGGDQTMVSYLQRLFGAAVIGKLLYHVFPIFLGAGANGKSTLFDIMRGALNTYAAQMPSKFLVESRNRDAERDMAKLRGVRFATHSEVPPSARFDEELVKVVSGESMLRMRLLYKESVEIQNTSTNMLGANHLPGVTVGGTGFWRRTRLIHFGQQMPIADQNPLLAEQILNEEGPGVLQWMIDGAIMLQHVGLADPPKVLAATKLYRFEEDVIARFIDEEMVIVEGMECDRKAVYDRYRQWVGPQGVRPSEELTAIKFARDFVAAVPGSDAGRRGTYYGVALRSNVEYTDD